MQVSVVEPGDVHELEGIEDPDRAAADRLAIVRR